MTNPKPLEKNVTKWLEITEKELKKYVGAARDKFLLEKLKSAGFDINKHIASKKRAGKIRFIQSRVEHDN